MAVDAARAGEWALPPLVMAGGLPWHESQASPPLSFSVHFQLLPTLPLSRAWQWTLSQVALALSYLGEVPDPPPRIPLASLSKITSAGSALS